MTTATLTWQAKKHWPLPFMNMLDKLDSLFTVKEIVRVAPTRIVLRTKTKKGMKRALHVISHETRVMRIVTRMGDSFNSVYMNEDLK